MATNGANDVGIRWSRHFIERPCASLLPENYYLLNSDILSAKIHIIIIFQKINSYLK